MGSVFIMVGIAIFGGIMTAIDKGIFGAIIFFGVLWLAKKIFIG